MKKPHIRGVSFYASGVWENTPSRKKSYHGPSAGESEIPPGYVYEAVRLLILILLLIPLTPKRQNLSWLALGDSYTIGESVAPEDRYPSQVMRALCSAGYS